MIVFKGKKVQKLCYNKRKISEERGEMHEVDFRKRMIKNSVIHAFTFVEMALVLLIIGFLLAIVAGGTSLINTSRVQSVISERGDYQALYDAFKMRYNGRPGDTLEGYIYWKDSGCTDDNVSVVSTGCNGDGDTRIGDVSGYESLLAWQHIHWGGGVEYPYAGVVNNDDVVVSDVLRNVPESDVEGAGWYMGYVDIYGVAKNALTFARIKDGEANRSIFSPKTAEDVDLKLDDGLPDAGGVLVLDGVDLESGVDCVDGVSGEKPAVIIITEDDIACQLVFLLE